MLKKFILFVAVISISFSLHAENLTKDSAEKYIDSFFSGEGKFIKVIPAYEYIYYFNKDRIDQIQVNSVGLTIIHDGEKFTFVFAKMIPTQYIDDISLDKKGNLVLKAK